MTERESFYPPIRANPSDDTVRLVFADWLEENGETDQDAATVEFIRISCTKFNDSKVMPLPAYQWIEKNWQRLVPTFVTKFSGKLVPGEPPPLGDPRPEGFKWWVRRGRNVHGRARVPNPHVGRRNVRPYYTVSFVVAFWKGFAQDYTVWSAWGFSQMMPVLLRDQPILDIPDQPAEETVS